MWKVLVLHFRGGGTTKPKLPALFRFFLDTPERYVFGVRVAWRGNGEIATEAKHLRHQSDLEEVPVCPSSPGWCSRHWYGVGTIAWRGCLLGGCVPERRGLWCPSLQLKERI